MLDTSPTARHVSALPLGVSPPSPTWRHLLSSPHTYLSTREMEVEWSNPNTSSNAESESSSHGSRLGEVELDAARALADLAKIEKERVDLNESKSRNEQLQNGSQDNKAVSEFSIPNIRCSSSHGSCFGRRVKQDMTEAEREAKRIRRVLANRESARQTIRRRQALREELIRRVSELSIENTNMKMEKELVMREYQAPEETNKKLKEQVSYAMKVKVETEAEFKPDSPSTELSLVVPCGVVSSTNKSSYGEAGGTVSSALNTDLYAPPVCTIFYPILQKTISESYTSAHHHGFMPYPQVKENVDSTTTSAPEKKNMNVNTEETSVDLNQNKVFQHDPCRSVADRSERDTMDINAGCDEIRSYVEEKSQAAMKKLVDPNAAAAARRRRKELTKLRYLHGKQIRLHG